MFVKKNELQKALELQKIMSVSAQGEGTPVGDLISKIKKINPKDIKLSYYIGWIKSEISNPELDSQDWSGLCTILAQTDLMRLDTQLLNMLVNLLRLGRVKEGQARLLIMDLLCSEAGHLWTLDEVKIERSPGFLYSALWVQVATGSGYTELAFDAIDLWIDKGMNYKDLIDCFDGFSKSTPPIRFLSRAGRWISYYCDERQEELNKWFTDHGMEVPILTV